MLISKNSMPKAKKTESNMMAIADLAPENRNPFSTCTMNQIATILPKIRKRIANNG